MSDNDNVVKTSVPPPQSTQDAGMVALVMQRVQPTAPPPPPPQSDKK